MDSSLIAEMVCPYCGSGLQVSKSVVQQGGRLQYGLVQCQCFVFPVVNGVLLLSLFKGYGGAEEAMQPYVPLQVAALRYLEREDVDGLKAWIRRHMPLIGTLIDGTSGDYLSFNMRMSAELERSSERYLDDQGRYEVLGYARSGVFARWIRRARHAGTALRRRLDRRRALLRTLTSFYGSRFFGPRTQSLALQALELDLSGRVLSLCGGHGVFENLLAAAGKVDGVTTIDGQLINLFVIQRYINHRVNLVCHDVQLPLPFHDSAFDAVFSSTCVPEVPAQKTFIAEAMRVGSEKGWVCFDSIWNTGSGVKRVNPLRDYRFCQNFFDSLSGYVGLIRPLVRAPRVLAAAPPAAPGAYRGGMNWRTGDTGLAEALAACSDAMVSFLVAPPSIIAALRQPSRRGWLATAQLSISPVYAVSAETRDVLRLVRRSGFEDLPHYVVPRDFPGYEDQVSVDLRRLGDIDYRLDLFCRGVLALLPAAFWSEARPLPVRGLAPERALELACARQAA